MGYRVRLMTLAVALVILSLVALLLLQHSPKHRKGDATSSTSREQGGSLHPDHSGEERSTATTTPLIRNKVDSRSLQAKLTRLTSNIPFDMDTAEAVGADLAEYRANPDILGQFFTQMRQAVQQTGYFFSLPCDNTVAIPVSAGLVSNHSVPPSSVAVCEDPTERLGIFKQHIVLFVNNCETYKQFHAAPLQQFASRFTLMRPLIIDLWFGIPNPDLLGNSWSCLDLPGGPYLGFVNTLIARYANAGLLDPNLAPIGIDIGANQGLGFHILCCCLTFLSIVLSPSRWFCSVHGRSRS